MQQCLCKGLCMGSVYEPLQLTLHDMIKLAKG